MNVFEQWLEQFFDEVEPKEFYRTIFPEGELDKRGELNKGKYTGIIVEVTKEKKQNGRPKIKRWALLDDLEAVDQVCASDNFCLCSPVSYCGKERTAEHARFAYAIAVDLDRIRIGRDGQPVGLIDLWNGHIEAAGRIPKPTFIVSSGTGLHLYYVLEKPVALFQNTTKQLQKLKHELTWLIWNEGIADIKDERDIQQEGIFQGFRMPGTITKNGSRAKAYQTGDRVTLEYLNDFVTPASRVTEYAIKSKLTKAEAKKKYPEWYERRIENKEPRGTWHISRNLYDWWKREILRGAEVGHRYYCMMMLSIYAKKCSMYDEKHNPTPVTYEELENDAFEIMDYFETLTNADDNHFDESDVQDALEAYNERYLTFPRTSVEYRSGIRIKENKRNGRKQSDHVRIMNFVRDEIERKTDWNKVGNGRKQKKDTVLEWIAKNPDGKKADCIRETGLDKKTVYKWWNEAKTSG